MAVFSDALLCLLLVGVLAGDTFKTMLFGVFGKPFSPFVFTCIKASLYSILICFWVVPQYLYSYLPAPGKAVLCITVAAGVMSLQPNMKGWHQATWVVLLCGFVYFEMRAIDSDQQKSEEHFTVTANRLGHTTDLLTQLVAGSKRVEIFLRQAKVTHNQVTAKSAKGALQASSAASWIGIAEGLSSTLRKFGHEWEYAENQLELEKDAVLTTTQPPSPQEVRDAQDTFELRTKDLNDRYQDELATSLSDARAVQEGLLAYIPTKDRLKEDKHQEDVLNQISGKLGNVRQYYQYPKELPIFSDYLDDLVKRIQARGGT